jgi:hypothetical protein
MPWHTWATPAEAEFEQAAHDIKQLRRHSSWIPADWEKLVYRYKKAYGSSIKGL